MLEQSTQRAQGCAQVWTEHLFEVSGVDWTGGTLGKFSRVKRVVIH